jgi:hypothetical protein
LRFLETFAADVKAFLRPICVAHTLQKPTPEGGAA